MRTSATINDSANAKRFWLVTPSKWRRFGLFLVAVVVILVGLRFAFFSGPYQSRTTLPSERIVDLHCHIAGIGAGGSGCLVSSAMQQSYKFRIYLNAFGTTLAEVRERGDGIVGDRLSEMVSRSEKVGKVVVLAMDGAVKSSGEFDSLKTEIYVPNEFVYEQTQKHSNFLFGASIHPYRSDALARLDWVAQRGAVLIKWIPSIMQIDPADPRTIPFYRRMAQLKLPLLSHVGQERSFSFANDSLCDPVRLRLALEQGVKVIAAHIASTGENEGERDIERLVPLMREFPNLYSEISSLTQVNKLGYLREALTRPEFKHRLLYGSDFPLINMPLVSAWYYPLQLTQSEMREISALENPFDRDIALKQSLGVPTDIFQRTSDFLKR